MTWKDIRHPQAGGAEVVNDELAQRLSKDGHQVIFLTAGYKSAAEKEQLNGYQVVRLGNRWNVYWQVYRYYRKHLRGWADIVIDEMNTIPFFCSFYAREKTIMFVHQLCRQIWFHQMVLPLSLIGYLIEPLYLRVLRKNQVVTVSESTKQDLIRYGFKPERVHIIAQGMNMKPVDNPAEVKKFLEPTIISFGSIRSMKRTDHIIQAFQLAKHSVPQLRLILAGDASGTYAQKLLSQIRAGSYAADIDIEGRVDEVRKRELLQKSHLLCAASVKEGWGLIVTEANSQGTPAVVYNVDGLRDSAFGGEVNQLCSGNSPQGMAKNIVELLTDSNKYRDLQKKGWEKSRQMDFNQSYEQFLNIIQHI